MVAEGNEPTGRCSGAAYALILGLVDERQRPAPNQSYAYGQAETNSARALSALPFGTGASKLGGQRCRAKRGRVQETPRALRYTLYARVKGVTQLRTNPTDQAASLHHSGSRAITRRCTPDRMKARIAASSRHAVRVQKARSASRYKTHTPMRAHCRVAMSLAGAGHDGIRNRPIFCDPRAREYRNPLLAGGRSVAGRSARQVRHSPI